MELKEISLAEALGKSSGTSFFSTFIQLVGKSQDVTLYQGINKLDYPLVKELEEKLGYPISINYLEFLKITNGGMISEMKYYSLIDKSNIDSLYYRNFISDTHKKYKLKDSTLIIGETPDSLICLENSKDDVSFTLMDIYNKDKLYFYYLSDLINFRFYFRLIIEGKKKKIEKEKLEKAKRKLKDELILQNKVNNKKAKESIINKENNIKR